MEKIPKEYENQINSIIINSMKEIQQLLEKMLMRCSDTMEPDIDNINDLVKEFIEKHETDVSPTLCDHHFVNDSIDIDLDRTTEIVYCDKCYVTKDS